MGDAGGCPCADVPKDPAVGSECAPREGPKEYVALGGGPEPRIKHSL